MESVVADLQGRLAELDRKRATLVAQHANDLPRQAHATERAAFLRAMFTTRHAVVNFGDPDTGEAATITRYGEPYLRPIFGPRKTMQLYEAAALLDVSEAEARALLPVDVLGVWTDYTDDGELTRDMTEVQAEDVMELLLKRQPRDRTRQLLHNLNARVLVGRARPAASGPPSAQPPLPSASGWC